MAHDAPSLHAVCMVRINVWPPQIGSRAAAGYQTLSTAERELRLRAVYYCAAELRRRPACAHGELITRHSAPRLRRVTTARQALEC